MSSRGNKFGFAFFDFLISLGVGHAYMFLNFVALHYLIFDRRSVERTGAYLARRFPGEPLWKRLWRTHRIFVNAGKVLVDLRCLERDPDSVKMKDDSERIRRLLKRGDGVIMLTAHVGNWQTMMRKLTNLETAIRVVMRPEDNPAVSEWLGVERGARDEVSLINPAKGPEAALEITAALANGDIVAIMADKPIEGSRTIEGKLFGKTVTFPEGPFLIAALADSPVVFPIPRRVGKLSYVLEMNDLEIPSETKGRNARRDAYLDAYCGALEAFLKAHPYDWTPAGEI